MKLRSAFPPLAALALAACATIPPAPVISPEAGAASFAARSLSDAGLRQFLAENLGREPAAWDFETLSWVAFYYHPSLDVARAQWGTARAAQQTASVRPNPTISLVPGYSTNPDAGVSPWFPAVNFDFLLQGNGKRAHQQDIARADAEVARLAVVAAAWQVRAELRRALIEFHAATQRAVNLRDQVETQKKLTALLEQRLAAGSASAVEVSATRTAQIKSEAALVDANGQARAARARVAAALGLPLAALEGVTLGLPPVAPALVGETLTAAQRQSLQTRADVLAALAKFQSSQAALELEAAKQQPDFHLGPGYQWDQGQNKWSLGLTFELPLFHRNEAPIAEATSRRAESAAQFNAAQAAAIAAIDAAVAAQTAAAEQRDHARRVRDEATQQVARAQQRFAVGSADQVERQTATLELATAELALTDADSAAALASGQLEDALQIPFPNLANLSRTP